MKFTAGQIAELLNGKVEGNEEAIVRNVSKIEEGKPETLTFLANPKYNQYIYTTKADVVIVNDSFEAEKEIKATLIRVPNAYEALAQLLEMYEQSIPQKTGIEQPSFVDDSAKLGDFVYVGAFAYIGENVRIGDNVKIYPHTYIGDNVKIDDNTTIYAGVKVYKNCIIGKQCTIHAGAVIGSDGFGFAPNANNEYKKVAQIGNVVLKDYVEIGANTTIDRATMGSTVVQKGVKLDNLIQIAHNVEIGENTVIAAQSGVAGSTKVGQDCMFGGQVGIAGHITIANGTKAGAQTGINKSIKKENSIQFGSPTMDMGEFNRSYVVFKRLPQLKSQLDELKKKLEE
ncbi:UDP-3-O-(3-hydroxymyristoyl)glucosamine N-acyltransferase [Carboxylicivirga sediminis]|uniref:UDP-3-O-acylglucosamine N-acyltransferase n=1 Tax=Carboxylicivirga sediminis TaxID=2006564 RepID=A0A941F0L2_9BACT|nr:UDP-3-O-(3-hydroxymyristoyl)glucosamine N-acyltransferase [Carboxylicivirga sediminis]MBR8534302.1 UDP-3-O-(3-hydroxymyristoyl)glucosamine N-acyltransferase [Carboxylicivirga sediminis]